MSWEIAWKATIILLGALGASVVCRRRSAVTRDWIWTLAFVAVLLLPGLTLAAPRWHASPGLEFAELAMRGPASSGAALNWGLWIWAFGFAGAVGRLAASHWRIAAQVRKAQPGPARLAWAEWREGETGTTPLVWGFFRPVVLLPRDFCSWPPALRESVLRHESAHVARGDCWKLLAGELACCLYWFHPLVWIAARQARRAREEACDETVLQEGMEASQYAASLIGAARRLVSRRVAAAVPFCSDLEGRVKAILTWRRRRAPSRLAKCLLALATAGTLLGLSGAAPAGGEARRAGGDAEPPKLIYKVEPVYTPEAKDAGIEGTVVLSIVVTKEGRTANVVVQQSLEPGLDAAAIRAVEQWRFQPARKGGEPVAVEATVHVAFRLN